MKKYLFYLLATIAVCGLVSLNACKKDDEHHANEATIEISSPTEGQMVMNGATLEIKATLTGKESLHGWKVELRKKDDGTVLFTADSHDHLMVLTIDETWTNNVTEHTNLELEVFAQLDHDGTMTSKIVNLHAHPM
jgi:hypothetical protein